MNDINGIIEDCNKSDLVSKKVIEKVIKIIGQKKWNRIHDEESDICTTMGEFIITLKGIPDLEQEKCELLGIIQGKDKVIKDLKEENAKLKKKLKEELKTIADKDLSFVARFDGLEKENAELKADYKVLSCSVGDFEELQNKLEEEQRKNNVLSDNLTQAKELLKWALHSDPEHDEDFDQKWEEAEQFLKQE